MSESTKSDPVRERILRTAGELFYVEGINAVGVDRISEAAPVSKRTLYQRFASKEELVTAYLKEIGEATRVDVAPEDEEASPLDRILAVFTSQRAQSLQPEFRGCPFVNASAELTDPGHPGRAVALEYKLKLQAFFLGQAQAAGAADPEELAEQLVMLYDGAHAFALVRGIQTPPSVLGAVKALVRAQTGTAGD